MAEPKKGVENFKRRTWDEEEYKRLAIEREDRERAGKQMKPSAGDDSIRNDGEDELKVDTGFGVLKFADPTAAGPSGSSKAYLDVEKARGELDLDSKIGKIEKVTGGSLKAGYKCDLCDRTFQDSLALLDHINGREHQSRLGFSMVLKPSSKEEVKSRLSAKIAEKTKVSAAAGSLFTKTMHHVAGVDDSFEARVKKAEEQMEANKTKQKHKSKPVKAKVETQSLEEEGADPEVLAALGFASFGGGK